MNTISSREAANRTRRAMALRDLLLEVGFDADRAGQLGEDGWAALARTIAARTGRSFRSPSEATRSQALGLLTGALTVVPVALPTAELPAPIGRNGRPVFPTNISLMVD